MDAQTVIILNSFSHADINIRKSCKIANFALCSVFIHPFSMNGINLLILLACLPRYCRNLRSFECGEGDESEYDLQLSRCLKCDIDPYDLTTTSV